MTTSSTQRSCPECGLKDSMVSDYHVLQKQVVCIGCGYVDAESTYKYVYSGESGAGMSSTGSSVHRLASTLKYSDKKGDTKVTKVAKDRLNAVASNYGLTQEMTKEATRLFEKALTEHPMFHRSFNEQQKIVLAGCCVYIVSRRHGLAVAVWYVANYLGTPRNVFFGILRQLIDALNLRVDNISLDVMTWSYLGEMILEADEMNKMCCTVRAFIEICKRTLVFEGVNTEPFLAAASYVAWCCITFPPRKTSFSKFCETMGAKCNQTSRRRLSELIVLLIELSKSVPWLAGKQVTKQNVFLHVETVLKYRKTLVVTREADAEKPNLFLKCVGKRRKRKSPPPEALEASTTSKMTSAPCEKNADDNDLDVIPADEMCNYLKTPQEIEYIKQLLIKFADN